MDKILVTGATGQLGSTVIEFLLKKLLPEQISILTRNEDKLQDFKSKGFHAYLGNYDNIPSLEQAMNGVDTVLLISSGDQGDRMQEHRNVIDTAQKNGVKNIAYTSRCLNDRTTLVNQLMAEHFQTEDFIQASGLKYIFFRKYFIHGCHSSIYWWKNSFRPWHIFTCRRWKRVLCPQERNGRSNGKCSA